MSLISTNLYEIPSSGSMRLLNNRTYKMTDWRTEGSKTLDLSQLVAWGIKVDKWYTVVVLDKQAHLVKPKRQQTENGF